MSHLKDGKMVHVDQLEAWKKRALKAEERITVLIGPVRDVPTVTPENAVELFGPEFGGALREALLPGGVFHASRPTVLVAHRPCPGTPGMASWGRCAKVEAHEPPCTHDLDNRLRCYDVNSILGWLTEVAEEPGPYEPAEREAAKLLLLILNDAAFPRDPKPRCEKTFAVESEIPFLRRCHKDADHDGDCGFREETRVRCTVCGALRSIDIHGKPSVCTFLKCEDPLKDWRAERVAAETGAPKS